MPAPIPQEAIARAITTAPAWALVGLTMPDEQMRENGAHELARWIAEQASRTPADQNQLALPL